MAVFGGIAVMLPDRWPVGWVGHGSAHCGGVLVRLNRKLLGLMASWLVQVIACVLRLPAVASLC